MGVAASMSLSLVVEGKLWGLIACHHREPHRLRQTLRSVCDLFAQMISLQLQEKLATKAHGERLRMKRIHAELVEAMVRENHLGEALIRRHPNLIDYIPAEGAAVLCGGRVTRVGSTPTDEQLCELVGWLNVSLRDGMFMTDCLAGQYAPAKDYADVASGIIALSASRSPQDYVFWFRPEVIRTVTWAGNPAKPVETGDDGVGLGPRKSFAAWQETVHGRSQPWNDTVAEAARDLLISMLDVVVRHMDQVIREREQARVQQDFLMAELDHRVKNTIATISSSREIFRGRRPEPGALHAEHPGSPARNGPRPQYAYPEPLEGSGPAKSGRGAICAVQRSRSRENYRIEAHAKAEGRAQRLSGPSRAGNECRQIRRAFGSGGLGGG